MQNTSLRIETILAKDLYTFYCRYVENAAGQQISPISKYRALSQSKNPCAEEGDVGLLVAYIGEQCVGYQGILPGWLRTPAGTAKVYWGTASYVLPEFRKRMVAVHLIRKLISLRKDLLVTYFNKPLADLFKGLHFEEIQPLEYVTVRMDGLDLVSYPFRRFYRLQKRWPLLRKTADAAIKVSRQWCYPAIRTAYYRSLARHSARALENIPFQEVATGKLSQADSFGTSDVVASFERSTEVIQWMVEFPWIQEGAAATHPPYFFSESYDSFRYFVLSLNDDGGKPRGFLVLSRAVENRTSKLKMLDFHCRQEDYGNMFWIVCKYAVQFQVDEIELPLQLESYAAFLPFASLVVKREQRRYLCYPSSKESPLALALPTLNLHLTDGDSPFT